MYESRLRNKWYIIIIIITDDKAKDATDKAKDAADKAKDDADKAKDDAEKVTTETKDKLKDGKSKDDADDDDDEAQAEAKEKLKKAQHAAAGKYESTAIISIEFWLTIPYEIDSWLTALQTMHSPIPYLETCVWKCICWYVKCLS